MNHFRLWKIVGLISCLAGGYGTSLVWTEVSLKKPAKIDQQAGKSADIHPIPRDRTLHLESLWSQRRGPFQYEETSQRVLAAVTSGKWDDASKKEAVSLLIRDPAFINTIWDKADPANRSAVMSELIKVVTLENPRTALELLDAGKFDFSQIPELGWRMAYTVRNGRSPIDALDAAKRNKHKLGQKAFDRMLEDAGYHEEIARVMMADAALGMTYSQKSMDGACAVLLRKDGALPPGTENLDMVKSFLTRKKAKDDTAAWLNGEKALTADDLKALDAKSVSEVLSRTQWHQGKDLDATQLELLAAAGHGEAQSGIFRSMIDLGQSENALRLLDEMKDMPATKLRRDALISTISTSIYESGGDVGEAARLMQGITDDSVYWKSMTKVLTNWATDDPPAGRAYLEQVTDPDLRRSLEKALAKASLDP